MIKRIYISAIAVFLSLVSYGQQKGQYSQYMVNHFIINPGFAGSKEVFNIALIQRYQWIGINGAPKTQTFTINTPLRNRRIGLGLMIMADEIGPTKTTAAMLSYAYRIRINRGRLAFGLRSGFYDFRYRWDMIEMRDKGDVYNITGSEKMVIPTADFGIFYNTRDYYAGISGTHIGGRQITIINKAGLESSPLSTHLLASAGKAFQINRSLVLNPSILVKAIHNTPLDFDINLHAQFEKKVWFGLSVKKFSGITLLTQYYLTDKLKAGYSYDIGLNKIGQQSKGSHEFYIGYDVNLTKSKTISPRYL